MEQEDKTPEELQEEADFLNDLAKDKAMGL